MAISAEAWRIAVEELALQSIKQDRIRVKSLHEGEAQGAKTDPAKGTAWRFYNAVVEYEDYGRKNSSPGSILFGPGAKAKERAFQELLAIARG
jgi:hypothetical protein